MALSSILGLVAVFLIFIIMILAVVYLKMSADEKREKSAKEVENQEVESKSKTAKSYTKESIFNFMEFDRIEDNMIVQKGGKKFLMVVECQGINFDLMSDIEKTAVESGFIQFLNTLRNPIQIYVQTRTINLEDSLKDYKERLKKIENELSSKEAKYKLMLESRKIWRKTIRYTKI